MPSVREISAAPVVEYFDASGNSLGTFTQRPTRSTGDNPYTKADDTASLQSPLTGTTITIADGVRWLGLTPAGTIATLTVNLPVSTNLIDLQEILISSSQTVTALTLGGNGSTINSAATTIAAGSFLRYKYSSTNTTWYRVG